MHDLAIDTSGHIFFNTSEKMMYGSGWMFKFYDDQLTRFLNGLPIKTGFMTGKELILIPCDDLLWKAIIVYYDKHLGTRHTYDFFMPEKKRRELMRKARI